MKLIIGGATGFVGKELLKQAIACPEITSIVTLGRRAVTVQDPKLTDIVVDDLSQYSDSTREKIAGADACIWYPSLTKHIQTLSGSVTDQTRTIAVARTKSITTPSEETRKVTLDYTLAGIKALVESKKSGQPLRFVYFSGAMVERVLKPDSEYKFGMPEYSRLRVSVPPPLLPFSASRCLDAESCRPRSKSS
jgi:putative NADH-flavin reductase